MMTKTIISLYLQVYCCIFLHELAHVLTAKVCNLNITTICIGFEQFALQIGKIKLSPIPVGGFVECTADSLLEKNRLQVILFYMSGPIINFLLSIVTFFLLKQISFFFILNLLNLIICIIPYLLDNDMTEMLHILNEL